MQDMTWAADKTGGFQHCSLDKGKIIQGHAYEGKQSDSYFETRNTGNSTENELERGGFGNEEMDYKVRP